VVRRGPGGGEPSGPSRIRGTRRTGTHKSHEERVSVIKSERTAFLWSFLGTAVPVAVSAPFVWTAEAPEAAAVILAGALVIGPSLGHFYADRSGRALTGIGIRLLAGAGIATVGLIAASSEEPSAGDGGTGLLVAGAALVAWDIIAAPHSARVHNERVRQRRTAVGITPSIGASGLGLCARASF